MYRKKLATRALTAIAASALLVSNVTTAAAASANVAQLVSGAEETEPEETQPEETETEETKPEETQPEETEPEETQPEETQPEETQPEEIEPEETQPEETQPEETQPEETQPEETQPEETEPEETQPEATQPEEMQPEETKPEETQPEETEPEETKPEETEPEEIQPVETKTAVNKLLMDVAENEEQTQFESIDLWATASDDLAEEKYHISLGTLTDVNLKDEAALRTKVEKAIADNKILASAGTEYTGEFEVLKKQVGNTEEYKDVLVVKIVRKTENKIADVFVTFVDQTGKPIIDLGENGSYVLPDVELENRNAFDERILEYVGEKYHVVTIWYPTINNNNQFTSKVVVKDLPENPDPKPEETVTVTAYFKDLNYLDVGELGTNGKKEFGGVKLSDIEAFKKQVTDYVKSMNYEVVDMGTPVAGNLNTLVIVKKAEEPKPEETVTVTAYFKDENYLDVGELGTNGKKEFGGVKLSDIEAFKKQVTDYVKSMNYEVVDMGTPVAGNLNTLVIVKKAENPKPEENVTVTVNFKDSNLGDVSDLGTNGVKDFPDVNLNNIDAFKQWVTDYVTSKGYEVVEIETPSAGSLSINVIVRKPETPTPTPEQASSKLTIQFKFGSKVMKSQELTYTGEKGKTTVITKDVVETAWIPSGYQVSNYFDDATLTYGTDLTLVVTLRLAGSGGSSASGGSGSSGTVVASGVLANGDWKQDNVGWWYSFRNGSYAKNGWYTLEWRDRLDWYYFNADGYLISGWYTDAAGNRYYLHPEHDGTFGRMYTGWNKVDGSWQFFNDNLQSSTYGAWAANTPIPDELRNK